MIQDGSCVLDSLSQADCDVIHPSLVFIPLNNEGTRAICVDKYNQAPSDSTYGDANLTPYPYTTTRPYVRSAFHMSPQYGYGDCNSTPISGSPYGYVGCERWVAIRDDAESMCSTKKYANGHVFRLPNYEELLLIASYNYAKALELCGGTQTSTHNWCHEASGCAGLNASYKCTPWIVHGSDAFIHADTVFPAGTYKYSDFSGTFYNHLSGSVRCVTEISR